MFFFFQYIRQNKAYVWPNILIHAENVFPVFPICSHLGIPSYFFTISSENVLFTDKMGVINLFTKQQKNTVFGFSLTILALTLPSRSVTP